MNKIKYNLNNEETILVVSDYPEVTKNEEKNHGIAWYTKQLIEPLAKNYNLKFVVLAEKGFDNTPKTYQDNNILVMRVFDKKHFSLFPRILKMLISFNKIKKVDVHSEFCANGSIKNLILLLPFLFLIKINRRYITYFAHNVVTDLNFLAPHLGMEKNSIKFNLLNFGLKFYYKILSLLVNRFVVMDEVIYNNLSQIVNPNKIFLSPFWIESKNPRISKEIARKKTNIAQNDFTLLYFGFVTYYKGADWIVKAIKKIRTQGKFKNISLVLAGGEAYSLKEKHHYQVFYQELLKIIKNDKHIKITGFVPERDIPLYFKAADVVVFPYRGIMGASGSLAHALSYAKPFLLSNKMGEILNNNELNQILIDNKLNPKDIIFSYNYKSFAKTLIEIQNKKKLKHMQNFSRDLASRRSIVNLINICYKNLYQEKIATSYRLAKFLPDTNA